MTQMWTRVGCDSEQDVEQVLEFFKSHNITLHTLSPAIAGPHKYIINFLTKDVLKNSTLLNADDIGQDILFTVLQGDSGTIVTSFDSKEILLNRNE